MPIAAADFRSRQRFEANDTTITDANLDLLRDDALVEVSKHVPALKTANLSIAPATTSYALPSDFLTMTTAKTSVVDGLPLYRLTTATSAVYLPGTGFHTTDTTLELATAPGVTATWVLSYGAVHTVATIPAALIPCALDYATARYYDRKATEAAAYFQYTTGSISVNKDGEAAKWRSLRDARLAKVDKEIAALSVGQTALGTFRIYRA